MKQFNKIVAGLLVSAAISAPAFGIGFDQRVGEAYAVADLGSISYGGLGSATAISVGAGYVVHPALAVEVDYLSGGSLSYGGFFGTPFSIKLDALQFNGVGSYSVNNEFSVYAKAGLAMNSQKWTLPFGFNSTYSGSSNSTDLTFGIGAKYKINKNLALRAQYQETGISSVNVISIGAMYSF